jgi:hypothetical protein
VIGAAFAARNRGALIEVNDRFVNDSAFYGHVRLLAVMNKRDRIRLDLMSARFHALSAVLQRIDLLNAMTTREAAQLHEAIDQILIARRRAGDPPRIGGARRNAKAGQSEPENGLMAE